VGSLVIGGKGNIIDGATAVLFLSLLDLELISHASLAALHGLR
jgi:hypothetical protein